MTKTESGKKYALIAAICYAVSAIYNIINIIIYVSNSEYATITVFNILFCIGMLGMAVALFVKNHEIVIVAAGVKALLRAYYIVTYFNVSNFHCIENREEVMKAISYLLANPQQNAQPTQNGSAPVANGSEAEQLKRLKDLLDAGVLTQEEFDAKKKQVLGL